MSKIMFCLYFQALNKKEHKGCDSPDPDCDPYMSSMNFEEKYNRMNEDYQRVLQQNQLRVGGNWFSSFDISGYNSCRCKEYKKSATYQLNQTI